MKFNSLIPELSVTDIEKSKKFYIDILGFSISYERPDDKFAFISLGDAQIMIEQINDYWATASFEYPFGRGINFQIEVDDVAKIRSRLVQNDIALFRDVCEECYEANGVQYMCKELLVQDPDGYLLRFSESL